MSDTIGILGQKYEDRKSKKVGTLLDRDAENKKLSFLGENGEPFTVTYAAFKSNWRKVIVAEPVNEVAETVEEPITETVEESANEPADETEYNASYENVVEAEPDTKPEVKLFDEDAKIKDFVKALTDARVASVDIIGDVCSVMADDVIICDLEKVENGYKMFMLPDIFIFTEWGDTFTAKDVHFNIKQGRHSGVVVDCVKASLGDILQLIKTAAVEINLYGYID